MDGVRLFSLLLSIVESVFESYRKDWNKLEMEVPYHSGLTEVLVSYKDCLEALRSGQRSLLVAGEPVSLDLLIPYVLLAHVRRIPVTVHLT